MGLLETIGRNPYEIINSKGNPVDVRGKAYMTRDGVGRWVPKEKVRTAVQRGYTVSPEVTVMRVASIGGKETTRPSTYRGDEFVDIPSTGFRGFLSHHYAGPDAPSYPRGLLDGSGAYSRVAEAGEQPTPTPEYQQAALRQFGAEAIPMAASMLPAVGPWAKIPGVLGMLSRAGIALGGGTAAQMGAQSLTGETVDAGDAVTRGGLASPAAQAAVGLGIEALLPPVLRGAGRMFTHTGKEAAVVGLPELLASDNVAVVGTNPVTRQQGIIRPSPTPEYINAADQTVSGLGAANRSAAQAYDQTAGAQVFGPEKFVGRLQASIQNARNQLIEGGGQQQLENALATFQQRWAARVPKSGATLSDIVAFKKEAGDLAKKLLEARINLKQSENPAVADALEAAAKEVWGAGDDILRELADGGNIYAERILENSQRMKDIIIAKTHMAGAERGLSGAGFVQKGLVQATPVGIASTRAANALDAALARNRAFIPMFPSQAARILNMQPGQ